MDRQYALQILFELAMQRGTVTAMMEMISLLLTMSDKNDNLAGNRFVKSSLEFYKNQPNVDIAL